MPADAAAHLEIERLIHEYGHRFDAADLDGFADLFANGTLVLTHLAPPATGADAVRATMEKLVILYDGSPLTNHVMTNVIIDIAPDGTEATACSYVQILQATPDLPLQIIATGAYDDRFALRDGRWGFVERRSRGMLVGNMSHHIRRPVRA